MATGRSDYPNQINNSCCFPGFFRGMLDVRARRVNDEMKLAAAQALAEIVTKEELGEEYITPSMFDSRVVPAVANAWALDKIGGMVCHVKPMDQPSCGDVSSRLACTGRLLAQSAGCRSIPEVCKFRS